MNHTKPQAFTQKCVVKSIRCDQVESDNVTSKLKDVVQAAREPIR